MNVSGEDDMHQDMHIDVQKDKPLSHKFCTMVDFYVEIKNSHELQC